MTAPVGAEMDKKDENSAELVYLKQLIDRGDFDELAEMVKFWKAVKSFGLFAGMVRRVVIGAAAFLLALAAVSESAREGIKKWLGI